MRKKWLKFLIIGSAFWWLSASARASGEFLIDYFENLSNWDTYGDVSFAAADSQTDPTSTGTMSLIKSNRFDHVSAQPARYLGAAIPHHGNFVFLFELSLKNYTVGAKFRVEYATYEDGTKDVLVCEVVDSLSGNYLQCDVYRQNAQGEETLLPLTVRPQFLHNTVDDGAHVMILIRRRKDYHISMAKTYIEVFPADKKEPLSGMFWPYLYDYEEAEIAPVHPRFYIGANDVPPSSMATLNIHRVWYVPEDYLFDNKVRELSQRDERWKDEILGHTKDQTIGQIGCLLTSITMLLNYHGYYQFADGSQLTPATLNNWLKNQPDGYINKNLLNIAAVTRLSNYLYEYYRSVHHVRYPKLEYHYHGGDNATTAFPETRIWHEEPYIQEIPGHFYVGKSYSLTEGIGIVDPFYSDHKKAYGSEYSMRRLVPSFTDQSYLMVNVIGQAKVDAYADQKIIATVQRANLYDPETDKVIGQQLLLPKPASGDYAFLLDSDDDNAKFNLFAYNIEGNVATYHPEMLRIDGSTYLEISYDRTASGEAMLTYEELEPWEVLWYDSRWEYAFTRYRVEQLVTTRDWASLSLVLTDFRARGWLTAEIETRLRAYMEAEQAKDAQMSSGT